MYKKGLNTTFVEYEDEIIVQTKKQLDEYFLMERKEFNTKVNPRICSSSIIRRGAMKNYFITILFILTLIYSCQKENSLIDPYPSGKFSYQSYDSLGSLIVDGWLTIEMVDTTRLKGDWYFNNPSFRFER